MLSSGSNRNRNLPNRVGSYHRMCWLQSSASFADRNAVPLGTSAKATQKIKASMTILASKIYRSPGQKVPLCMGVSQGKLNHMQTPAIQHSGKYHFQLSRFYIVGRHDRRRIEMDVEQTSIQHSPQSGDTVWASFHSIRSTRFLGFPNEVLA